MSNDQAVQRELRFLRVYAAVSGTVLILLSIAAFRREINVQRINIVEPDGKLRMVISDKARSISPLDHGKSFGRGAGTRPGIIFYNDEVSEDGGLLFEGQTVNGHVVADAQLSFDQYGQDQLIYLQYAEEKGHRSGGLYIDDHADVPGWPDSLRRIYAIPAGPARDSARHVLDDRVYDGLPMDAHRVFVGRDPAHSAILRLSDRQGRTRLRVLVDSSGCARIEFLDEEGRVVRSL